MKKILFVGPPTPGGPQYIYQALASYLKQHHSDELHIYESYSIWGWMKAHVASYDVIISAIPFLFPPLRTSVYYFHFHGNHREQRKLPSRGNKLLYLVEWNCRFAKKLIASSRYLPEILGLRKKYTDKRCIIPNPVAIPQQKNTITYHTGEPVRLLTVSSTKFYQKGKGIIDIAQQLQDIHDRNIERTIVAGGHDGHQKKLQAILAAMDLPSNIRYERVGRVGKEQLEQYYLSHHIFVYGTRLDTWGQTIVEAMSYGMPVLLLLHEARDYIYPPEYITADLLDDIERIVLDYDMYKKISSAFAQQYSIEQVAKNILDLLYIK